MSRKKKTDAADAQVEDLAPDNEPRESAGTGPAGSAAIKADAETGSDAIDQAAPADGTDDAGDESRGDAGDETALGDDEGPAAEEEDDAGLADELDEPSFEIGDYVYLIDDRESTGFIELLNEPEPYMATVKLADGGALMGVMLDNIALVEPEPDPADEPLHVDVLAACAAAAMVFGTHEHDATSLPVQDYSFLSEKPIRDAAQCAADFVRANPDTNAGVIPIHLGLKGHRPREEPIGHREHAAWSVFKATLDALDNMRKLEELDAEHARRAAEAKERRPSAPRDRLALQPQEDALRPTGFTPSR